jgi:hypothetical protein
MLPLRGQQVQRSTSQSAASGRQRQKQALKASTEMQLPETVGYGQGWRRRREAGELARMLQGVKEAEDSENEA